MKINPTSNMYLFDSQNKNMVSEVNTSVLVAPLCEIQSSVIWTFFFFTIQFRVLFLPLKANLWHQTTFHWFGMICNKNRLNILIVGNQAGIVGEYKEFDQVCVLAFFAEREGERKHWLKNTISQMKSFFRFDFRNDKVLQSNFH